jgi:hypothetical protein
MIKPTIGRKVWYWHAGKNLGQPEDATIVYVHTDSRVNLFVIDHDGRSRPELSVSLIHDDEATLDGERHCEWMPFQKGQAKAVEQTRA